MTSLTPHDYDYNDNTRAAAARHCDKLKWFAAKLDVLSGAEAISLAAINIGTQTDIAKLAGLSKSRLSEMKAKKTLTRGDKAALISAFVGRWIL